MPCIVNRETSVVPVVFLGLATIFLILSCVSVPLLDGVRLFRIHASISGARRYVDFGVWGYCVVPFRGFRGFDPSVTEGCSTATLGYTIGEVVTNALHTPDELQSALLKAHTSALVLFPIAAVYTAFTFLISVAVWLSLRNPKGGSSIGATSSTSVVVLAGLGTLITTLAFAMGLSVMVTVKSKVSHIRKNQGNLEFKWDSIIWLSALAALAHLYNLIFVAAMRKQRGESILQRDNEAAMKQMNGGQEQKPKKKKGKKEKKVHDEEVWNKERRESDSSRMSESDRGDARQRDAEESRESVASGQKTSPKQALDGY